MSSAGEHRTRWLAIALLLLFGAPTLALAQETPAGTIIGQITGPQGEPLAVASVQVIGTSIGTLTGTDGRFAIPGVPPGTHQLRITLLGFTEQVVGDVQVVNGQTVTVNVQLQTEAIQLQEIVAVGYGTQRREAITGSVSIVNAVEANVGKVVAPTQLLQGRVAGVYMVQNDGGPGSGVQVRIRGGTSITASNEPLYVVDGVPINNTAVEPTSLGSNSSLPRNPLTTLNPNDIESITVLKDASATAIYGSRGANGVVLIQTKQGQAGNVQLTYDTYLSMGRPSRTLDVLNGDEYRAFIEQEVAAGRLSQDRIANLGNANTNWEKELLRTAYTQNHNLTLTGGANNMRYHGSLNYANEQGVIRSSGLERLAGRINVQQDVWEGRLRLNLNVNASQVKNDYVVYENTGGFTGTAFTNMLIMNPTHPVTVTDPETGVTRFYEIGPGAEAVRNPVAIAEELQDDGVSRRAMGYLSADLTLMEGLTARVNVATDRSDGVRRGYYPKTNPLGVANSGQAMISSRSNVTNTFQSYLTMSLSRGLHNADVLGGYEFNEYSTVTSAAQAQGFISDAFGYNNLGAGSVLLAPSSGRTDSRLVSFFTRANYSLNGRYNLTAVLRYDGSSRFGAGNKWALFPAVSGSWTISDEAFMQNSPFTELRVKLGYGVNGSQEISPYSSLTTLSASGNYAFGQQRVSGVTPNRNPNPNLKWEQTAQWNMGIDFRFGADRLTGTIEYYRKKTKDLLLTVPVPQPAAVASMIRNIGSVENHGIEWALDARALSTPDLTVVVGLVGSRERNKVVSLGSTAFINSGSVSGQGQTGQNSQRIMPGHPLGTFYGPEFIGVDSEGTQLFNHYETETDEAGRIISQRLIGQTTTPSAGDHRVIGDANPDFTLGARGQITWRRFDMSFLIRGVFGQDVLNNTALVYSTKGNALQDKNFLKSALDDPIGIREPAIFSSRWIEDGSFVRFQNITIGYRLPPLANLPQVRDARVYVSGDNLLLLTGYTGYDPEVFTSAGTASRGVDYLNYPNPRTITVGASLGF